MSKVQKFLAEHGVEFIKQAIEEANVCGGDWIDTTTLEFKKYIPSGDSVFIGELKQVVESIEKITALGGIGLANLIDQSTYGEHLDLNRALANYKLVQAYKNGEA